MSFLDELHVSSLPDPGTTPSSLVRQTLGDAAVAITQGGGNVIKSAGELADWAGDKSGSTALHDVGTAVRDYGVKSQEQSADLYSPEAKAAMAVPIYDENTGKWTFGVRKTVLGALQSVPDLGVAMIPGAGLVKGAQLLKVGAGTASALEAIGVGANRAKVAGAFAERGIAGGLVEGAQAGFANAADTRKQIMDAPDAKLFAIPGNAEILQRHNGDTAAAREFIADQAAQEVLGKTAATTGTISAVLGGGVTGMLSEKLAAKTLAKDVGLPLVEKRLLGRMGEGMAEEAAQEGPQSYVENIWQNKAERDYLDPSKELTAGALNAGIEGALSGGLLGMTGGGARTNHISVLASEKTDPATRVEILSQIARGITDPQAQQDYIEYAMPLIEANQPIATNQNFMDRWITPQFADPADPTESSVPPVASPAAEGAPAGLSPVGQPESINTPAPTAPDLPTLGGVTLAPVAADGTVNTLQAALATVADTSAPVAMLPELGTNPDPYAGMYSGQMPEAPFEQPGQPSAGRNVSSLLGALPNTQVPNTALPQGATTSEVSKVQQAVGRSQEEMPAVRGNAEVAGTTQVLAEYSSQEVGLVARVAKIDSGFSVTHQDIDSGEVLSQGKIFKTQDEADSFARSSIKYIAPAAAQDGISAPPAAAPAATIDDISKMFDDAAPAPATTPVLGYPKLQAKAKQHGLKMSPKQADGSFSIGEQVFPNLRAVQSHIESLGTPAPVVKVAAVKPAAQPKPAAPRNFLQDIKKNGKLLHASIKNFLSPEDMQGPKGKGNIFWPLQSKSGLGMDTMASGMRDLGWQIPTDHNNEPDAQAFAHMVRDAVTGNRTPTHPDDVERQIAEDQAAEAEAMQQEIEEADADVHDAAERLYHDNIDIEDDPFATADEIKAYREAKANVDNSGEQETAGKTVTGEAAPGGTDSTEMQEDGNQSKGTTGEVKAEATDDAGGFKQQVALEGDRKNPTIGGVQKQGGKAVGTSDFLDGFTPDPEQDLFAAPKTDSTPKNTIFTEDAADKARAILKAKFNTQLSAGLDPELMQAGLTLAGYHIEKGARTFAAFAKAMLSDLGEAVKPYLKSWYMGIKYDPRAAGFEGIDDAATVESSDVNSLNGDIIEETTQGVDNVLSSGSNLESNSGEGKTADGVGPQDVQTGSGRPDGRTGVGVRPDGSAGGNVVSGTTGVPYSETAFTGEYSDQPILSGPGSGRLTDSATRSMLGERSGDTGIDGSPVDAVAAKAVVKAAARILDLKEKQAAQLAAQSVKVISGDLANIEQSVPFLLPGQRDDVKFAEDRFAKPDGYGVLFTNGTGTGKTYTGLGIIKRLERQGKKNILIVSPSKPINEAWVKSGRDLHLEITALNDTKDAGKGIVITTYANFRDNAGLVNRNWDAIVFDEAQNINSNAAGEKTRSHAAMHGLTLHPDGVHARARMKAPDLWTASEEISKQIDALTGPNNEAVYNRLATERTALLKQQQVIVEATQAEVTAAQGTSKRPRTVFLSATPFAYMESVQYGNGYLFDWNEGQEEESGRGYNSGSNHQRFMMRHFGYAMRTGKLNKPGHNIDQGVMQRQFNSWLKSQGVLSGRMLDSDYDYDRKFVLIDSGIGRTIDDGLSWLREHSRMAAVEELVRERFDYLSRRYLLEAIKAREAIPVIKEHIAMGRKVVVFHDYNRGGGTNPFDVSEWQHSTKRVSFPGADGKRDSEDLGILVREFMAARPDLVALPFNSYKSAVEEMKAAFPGLMQVNGPTASKQRSKNITDFQTDSNGQDVILVQADAGGAGISLHDTTGVHARVLINLGMPTKPVTAIQQEGRIYRVGQASNAMFRYFNTGTNWERFAFATAIAVKTSGAENLAAGESARAMMDAFVDGFQESGSYKPGHEDEGTGGKERDRMANSALTEYDKARTHYWASKKGRQNNIGADFFATPEPVGFKMSEWADVSDGEAVLEPSGGKAAIARYFNPLAKRDMIEPSFELVSSASLVFDGKIIQGSFEDHHVGGNKYDAIVMNPPFGSAGKTAMDHLEKAAKHLKSGGRIVALIPSGPSMDKRLDKWMAGEEIEKVPAAGTVNGQDIYVGDQIDFRPMATPIHMPGTGTVTRMLAPVGGAVRVFFKNHKGTGSVEDYNIHSIDPTGPRERKITNEMTLVADIKLPSVTFERAGTKVNTHIVILDKNSDSTASAINRDYTDMETTNDLFDRIEGLDIPKRSRTKKEAATTQENAATAIAPESGPTDAPSSVQGLHLENITHTKTGAALFSAKMTDKVSSAEYKVVADMVKANGGMWSRFTKSFLFNKESGRDGFVAAYANSGTQFSLSGQQTVENAHTSTADFTAEARLSANVAAMQKSGILEIVMDSTETPAGAKASGVKGMVTKDGKMYLVVNQIEKGQVGRVIMHETVHQSLEVVHGTEAFNALMKQMEALRDNGNKSVNAAFDLVPGNTAASDVTEEALGYLQEINPNHSIVQRLVSMVKAWLFKKGWLSAKQMDNHDMVAIVRGVMKQVDKNAQSSKVEQGGIKNENDTKPTVEELVRIASGASRAIRSGIEAISRATGSQQAGSSEYHNRETEALKTFAERYQFGREHQEFSDQYKEQTERLGHSVEGVEHDVLLALGDGVVIKRKALGYEAKEYLQRLVDHNELFPETAYSLDGISEKRSGGQTELYATVSQPYIKQRVDSSGKEIPVTFSELRDFFKTKGFAPDYESDTNMHLIPWANERGDAIYDLAPRNVIIDESGDIFTIDPQITKAENIKYSLASESVASARDFLSNTSPADIAKGLGKMAMPDNMVKSAAATWPKSMAALNYLFSTPVFHAERDARKRKDGEIGVKDFTDAGISRAENNMETQLDLMGYDGPSGVKPTLLQRAKEGLTTWESSDTTTEWGRIEKEVRSKLAPEQQAAVDILQREGDVNNKVYETLADAMKNSRVAAAKPTQAAFDAYKRVRDFIDGPMAEARERQIIRLGEVTGTDKKLVANTIKAYRAHLGTLKGWMPRKHGEGSHQVNVHHTIKALPFVGKAIEAGHIASLPFYAGNAVAKEIRAFAKANMLLVHRSATGGPIVIASDATADKIAAKIDALELKIKLGSVITSEVEHWQEQLAVLQGKLALASRPADVRIAEFMEASKGFLGNVRAQYETEMQGLRTQRAEAEAEGAHKGRMQEIKAEMAKLGDGSVKVKVYMRLSETERQADKLKSEVSGNLPAVLDHVYHQGETYTTSYEMIDQVSEGQYGDMVGDFASENIIKKAIEKAQQIGKVGNEDAAGVKQALFRNFADVMLARGAGRHQIRRSEYLIQGYDQENTTQIYRDYMTGAAGMLSKAMYAKQQFDNYRYAPADVKPWAEKYIKDTLRNMGHTDRIGGNVRALATFMYLGFKVSSILINGTQAWTLGVAELGRRTKQNSVKAIGKAQLDILKSRLSKEEEDIFNNQLWKEQEMATAIHEMSGAGEGATGKASKFMHTLVGKSLLPFQEMEMMNRRTMVLASYRSFLADGMSKTDALAEAMDVNRKTNFEMSRANLPGFANKPVGRTVYALQSFVWNNWNWIYNRATSGEKADILALLKYAGMITAIGGVAALAGGDEINKLIRRLTGKDHRMAMEVWTRKHAKEFGTAGELMNAAVWHGGMGALGVNVSNAMRLNIPMSGWITGDSTAGESAMGIWSGMYDKGANTLKYASRGQIGRALESAAPAAIEAPMKAYRMATQGATTSHGKPVFDENGKPLKYSGLDAAKRAIGLQPAEQSFRSEVSQSLVKTKAYWSEQRGTLLDSLRVAGNQGDRKSVMKDILKFNKDVRKSQAWPLVGVISFDTIRRSQAASKPDRKKQQWMRKNIE